MTREQRIEAIVTRVAAAVRQDLLTFGYDGTGIDVPELGERWIISREAVS